MNNTFGRMAAVFAIGMLLLSALPIVCSAPTISNAETADADDEEYTTPFTLVYHHDEGTNSCFTGGRNGDTPLELYKIFLQSEKGDIYYLPAGDFTQKTTLTISKSIKIVGEVDGDGTPVTHITKGYYDTSKNNHLFNCALRTSPELKDRLHIVLKNLLLDNDTDNLPTNVNCGIQAIGNVKVDVYNTVITNFNYSAALSVNAANTTSSTEPTYNAVDTELHCYGVSTKDNYWTGSLFALPRYAEEKEQGQKVIKHIEVLSHAYLTYDKDCTFDDDYNEFAMEEPYDPKSEYSGWRDAGYGNCLVNGYSLDEPSGEGVTPADLKGGIYRTEQTRLAEGYKCINTIVDGRNVWVVTDKAVSITYDSNGGTGSVPDTSWWIEGSDAKVDLTTVPSKSNCMFVGWSPDPSAQEPTVYDATDSSFKITKDTKLYAVYKERDTQKHLIEIKVGEGGSATQSTQEVGSGSFKVFFKANDDFKISSVIVDGQEVGAVQYYEFASVTSDHSIEVKFESSEGTRTNYDEETGTVTEEKVTESAYGTKTETKTTDGDGNATDTIVFENKEANVETVSDRESIISVIDPAVKTAGEKKDSATVSEIQLLVAMKQTENIAESVEAKPVIVIDTGEASSAETKKTDVSISLNDTTKGMMEKNDISVVSATGTITMDSDTLKSVIEGQTDATTIILSVGDPENLTPAQEERIGNYKVISAELLVQVSSGETIPYKEQFTGKVWVALHYEIHDIENFRIFYVDEEGKMTEITEKEYDPVTQTVMFVAPHFSEYMITDPVIEDTTIDNIVVAIIAASIILITLASVANYSRKDR